MRQPPKNKKAETEPVVTLRAGPAQIERLVILGVINADQAAAGRKAGGLLVSVPARLVDEFERNRADFVNNLPLASLLEVESAEDLAQIERLARRLDNAGLNTAARLFIGSNRPLSFFASQLLLLAQPMSRLALGRQDVTGRYSRLLEKRGNLDYLLFYLEELEAERRKARSAGKKERK